MTDEPLFMVRCEVDVRRLAGESIAGAPSRGVDDIGHGAHSLLAALFGEGVVQPFRVLPAARGRGVPLLGYSTRSRAELEGHAHAFADPGIFAAVCWERFGVKPMPTAWAVGRELAFEVRVCPVVRLAGPLVLQQPGLEPRTYPRGAEIDAWVHASFGPEADRSRARGEVYREWLEARLRPGARLVAAELAGFRRVRLLRRDHTLQRRPRVIERPEVIVAGRLEVADSGAFVELLRRGVGRHRAFGFGMMLLRAPR